jgi:hypothetical protein
MPPRIDDTRRLFGHVFAMKFEPEIEHLKRWFLVERNSGHGIDQCIKIADFVTQAKRYSDEDKIEFLSRKATNLYTRGRNEVYFSPEKALSDIEQSLRLHLQCFTKNFDVGSTKIDKSEEYARNTAYFLFDFTVLHDRSDDFFRTVGELCENSNIKLDPIEAPLIRSLDLLTRDRLPKAEAYKRRNKLDTLRRILESKSAWYDSSAKKRLAEQMHKTGQLIAESDTQQRRRTN